MNLKEAYQTLELSESASPEEAKKKYRKLTKQYHPDVNKDPEAESKFKKINEAYQCVQDGKGNDRQNNKSHYPWGNGTSTKVIKIEHIELTLTIDFKESVLGCKKEIKYSRQSKCSSCGGSGELRVNNGCKDCSGTGQITFKNRGMSFISTCPKCQGKCSTTDCGPCKGQGRMYTDVSIYVTVPAGIIDGNVLRLQGMGNYIDSIMGMMDQNTDVFCHIRVIQDEGLNIEGHNVLSTIELPLLDALRGCKRKVKTIFGDKEIEIKPQSRNRDEVIIPNHGVGGTGDQKIILDVKYPNNTDKLIGVLVDEVI